MKFSLNLLFTILLPFLVIAQDEIEIADLTVKVGKNEEIFYYGFAEGDEITFDFKVVEGKKLKEFEFFRYPEKSIYLDYETSSKTKTIKIRKEAVYGFRFYNSNALKKKICKLRISRKPASEETVSFNTEIRWEEKYDTTFKVKTKNITTGYNSVIKQKSKKVLSSIDTSVVLITERVERVEAKKNEVITFTLPKNEKLPNFINPYETKEVVSWAYSIATGENGKAWQKDANKKAVVKKATSSALKLAGVGGPQVALALLAIEGFSVFSNPPNGEDIKYSIFTGDQNGQTFPISQGNSVAVSSRMTDYKQGNFALQLFNDNVFQGVNVNVNILAIVVTKKYEKEYYEVTVQEPIKEKQVIKSPKKVEKYQAPA